MKMKLTLWALLISLGFYANAQQLMTENFDYTSSSPLTSHGWTVTAPSSTLPIATTTAGLTFSGYTLSGIGNAAQIDTTGQDIYRDLYNSTTAGNLFTSFMLNVSKATATGDYFFAYLPQSSSTNFVGRLYIKAAGTGFYRIGISKQTEAAVYSADSFAYNNTSLVVIKYSYASGNTNDTISVFNFTSALPTAESIPAVYTVGGNSTDAATIGRLALRQGSAANAPRLQIDGIRTANTWAELNAATNNNQPSQFTVTYTNTTTASTRISWVKNTNYIDSMMTTMVFVKPLTAINIGTPNLSPSAYTADANFATANSYYQNDGAAKCVFLADSNAVTLTGLNQNTLYQIIIFTVRNYDSAYSAPLNGSFTTLSSAPRAVTGLNFTAIERTGVTINWTRPNGYNAANNTIAVYVKEGTSIAAGTPNTNPNLINADVNFMGAGSKLAIDSNARCVYIGDTTTVTITGLNPATNYYIAAYAINNIDSNYSPAVEGSFRTNSLGPVNVKSATLVSFSSNSCRIAWTKDTSYNNANFTTLVFLKQGTNINQGAPDKDIANIYGNDSFMLGSVYQYDTAAFCVYKGDSNFVVPVGLNPATNYFALIYVVSDADSLYSNPTIIGGSTRGVPPENVSAITVAGITNTSTKISWTKPSNYSNANFTTLVFLKANNSINQGVPSKNVNYYNSSTVFTSSFSTRYQNDTAAKCVYKGDTNFVNVTSINNYTNYHVLIYVVRDVDSTYSINGSVGNGSAAPNPLPPAYYTISQINGISLTTGVPDSLNVRVALRGIVYGPNQRTAGQGIQFLLRDNTGGITISNNTTFNYTPAEGDSISVFGIVSTSRGLLTLTTLDSLAVLANGKTIPSPKVVTTLNESTENDLVRINIVKFLNKPVDNLFRANMSYQVINLNNDTATMRVFPTSGLVGAPIPTTTYFHVIGFGSQSSNNTAPFAFTGYQILPFSSTNIIPYNPLSAFNFVNPNNNDSVKIEGDTNQILNFIWTKSMNLSPNPVASYTLLADTLNGNFRNPIAVYQSGNTGFDTSIAFTYGQIRNIITPFQIPANQHVSLKFKVLASSSVFTMSSDTIVVNFTLGYNVGVNNKLTAHELVVYPNPVNDKLMIQLPENVGNTAKIEVMDLTGKVLLSQSVESVINSLSIDCNLLKTGMYLVKLQSDNLILSKKIFKY